MALTFPRDPFMEWFLPGLGWVDVSTLVRQTAPVVVVRGRQGEQDDLPPSTLSALLDNATGDADPDDVLGQWYGLLGPNVPVKWGFRVVDASFDDPIDPGLGDTDTGEIWTLDGPVTDFSQQGGVAEIDVPSASTIRMAYLTYLAPFSDYEVKARFTIPTRAGAVSTFGGLMFRGSTTLDFCRVSLVVSGSGVVTMLAIDEVGSIVGSADIDLTNAGFYSLSVIVEGRSVRAKAWRSTDVEPADWGLHAVIPTDMNAVGWVGVRVGASTGATALTVLVDDFSVRLIRFSGELTDLVTDVDKSHRIRSAELLASGVTQRLTQGRPRALKSALRRYVTGPTGSQNLLAYWALDDEKNAEVARLTAGSGSDAEYRDITLVTVPTVSPARVCGRGDLGPWNGPTALVKSPALFVFPFSARSGSVTTWTQHISVSFDGPYGGSISPNGIDNVTVTMNSSVFFNDDDVWFVTLSSFLGEVELTSPDGTSVSASAGDLYDGNPHLLTIRVTQSGSDCVGLFRVDGSTVVTVTQVGYVNTYPKHAFWLSTGSESKPRSVSHVIGYEGNGPSSTDLVSALYGWSGEAAGLRMQRLCEEEGVPFDYEGDLADTTPMGPQYATDHLVASLRECARTDQGGMYEPRSVTGLGYRTRSSITAQDAVMELDYAAGHVFDIKSVTGDRATRNVVAAQRRDGGEFVAEQVTGPKNTADPGTVVGAVGIYDSDADVNTQDDSLLRDVANRELARGTAPEPRFERLGINLRSAEVFNEGAPDPALTADVLGTDVEDRVLLVNLSARGQYEPADQLARGYTEVLANVRSHSITFNTTPFAPYRPFVLDADRLDSDASTLAAPEAAGQALPYTLSVAVSDGTLWTTEGAEFPFDVMIAGQRLTISAISGAASPQTFTVSARANGVDKAQAAGAQVVLADPGRLG